MDAVILAAGIGSRLNKYTLNTPKCLVKVNDKPILLRQLEILQSSNIDTIYVVGGCHFKVLKDFIDSLEYKNIVLIENKDYLATNNMYSLSMVSTYLKNKDFLWLNGDVVFEKEVIEGLLSLKLQNGIAVDKRVYLEESMKITFDGHKITAISKQIKEEDAYATSIDIYKINKETSIVLFNYIEEFLKTDKKSWSEVALNNIFSQCDFTYYAINCHWVEIDNEQDLIQASQLF